MLEQNTMKAIIEAMLFVSEKPVTLRQMITRIRHVIRKEQEQAQGLGSETDGTVEAQQDLDQLIASDDVEFSADGMDLETTQKVEFEEETIENEAVVTSEEDNEITQSVDDAVSEITASVSDEVIQEVVQAVSEDDDVRAQLMQKQKELDDDVTTDEIKKILFAIEEDLQKNDRGIELVQVAKGYQLRTKYEIAQYLKDEKPLAPSRLSPSSLETLAIVAYEQPVNRTKIEDIRGVDCGGVLKTLLDKDFVRIVGRSDEPGRPLVYGTTTKFLEVFGLNSLRDLPKPEDFQEFAVVESSNVEVADEDGNEYIHARDFEDADATSMSEAERSILEELDNSLLQLKDVEKGMDFFKSGDAQTETPVEAAPSANGTDGSN